MDWKTLIISVLTSGGLATIIIKLSLKNFFDKISDERKFDFDRKLHDFSLYSTKKFETYPEIYKKVSELRRELSSLTVYHAPHKLNTTQELRGFMLSYGIPSAKINDLLNKVNTIGIDEVKKEIGKVIFIIELDKISNLVNLCNDYFSSNELFVSNNVAEKTSQIINDINTSFNYVLMYLETNFVTEFPYSIINKLELNIMELRDLMTQELDIEKETNK